MVLTMDVVHADECCSLLLYKTVTQEVKTLGLSAVRLIQCIAMVQASTQRGYMLQVGLPGHH